MTFLVDAYTEDEAPNTKGGVDKRVVLRLDQRLAPVKAAVLPLSRNADLSPKARDLAATLRQHWNIDFDDAGAIGRRYRRQDEIGTPFCITVDFDTLEDHAVTIRERDSMAQERVALDQVEGYLGGAPARLLTAAPPCGEPGRPCRAPTLGDARARACERWHAAEVDEEFARYVRARQHRLLRAAYLVCGDAHLAEDLLQGALAKLATRWERLRHENPDAYVRKILYRDAVSSWRRTRRESLSLFPLELPVHAGPSRARASGSTWSGRWPQLTPKQRAVIVLRYFEDRSEADTAEALGVSVGTVKSQTHAALARLRTLMPDFAPHLSGRDQP